MTAEHDHIDRLIARVAMTRDGALRHAAFDKLVDKVVKDFAIKQELVYPIAKTWMSEGNMAELLAEHAQITRILSTLLWFEVADPQFDTRLETLMALVEGHMQWQEDELFAQFAQNVSTDEMAQLGANMAAWVDRIDATFTHSQLAA